MHDWHQSRFNGRSIANTLGRAPAARGYNEELISDGLLTSRKRKRANDRNQTRVFVARFRKSLVCTAEMNCPRKHRLEIIKLHHT